MDNDDISERSYAYVEAEKLMGEEEVERLTAFLRDHPNDPECVRVNTLRYTVDEFLRVTGQAGVQLKALPGISTAFEVLDMSQEVREWWNRARLFGMFYSQGNASMLPPLFLLDRVGPELMVLDMCAAPGSKTTQMGAMMSNEGLLVANDWKAHRLYALHRNVQVFGIANAVVTNMDGRILGKRWPDRFDRVLLDGPCSATGSNRRQGFSKRSIKVVHSFQQKQIGLLRAAAKALKAGEGRLIYSTCSLLPVENELILNPLLEEGRLAVEPLPELEGWVTHPGVTEWDDQSLSDQLRHTKRIYPHENDSDAFFIALLRKEDV